MKVILLVKIGEKQMKKETSKISSHIQIIILIISLIPLIMNCKTKEPPLASINTPPEIVQISISANQVEPGDSVKINVIATDLDGDRLQYGYNQTGGSITNPDSSVTFWIAPQDTGTYTITVIVSDGKESVQDSVTITVRLPNRPPKIESISITRGEVAPGDSVEIHVIASDPDGDKLQYSYDLTGGSITDPDSSVTLWIAPQVEGTYTITITVSDGNLSDKGSVIIKVRKAITITYPTEGDSVDRSITILGRCSTIPDGYYIWLVVQPDIEPNWYPQGTSSSTDWSIRAVIGLPNSIGEKFWLIATLIKKDGDLDEKLKVALQNESYITADEGNPDIKLQTKIYVYRK